MDVVIVGGGLAGLSTADRLLERAAPGTLASITILEACPERVGGRTHTVATEALPGARVDKGGQWLGSKQEPALKLARELGLTLHPQWTTGKRVLQLGSVITAYKGLIPNISWAALVDAQLVIIFLGFLQLMVRWNVCCRWWHRWADRQSMADVMKRFMWTAGGRALVTIVVQALFGAEPAGVSALAFTRYVNASGSIEEMSEIGPGSLQAYTVVGGAQQLSEGLARRVQSRATSAGVALRLLLGRRVVAVTQDGPSISVRAAVAGAEQASEEVHRGHSVVLAVPPPCLRDVAFNPPLPPHRQALVAHATMGCIIKSIILYPTAFWREAGFSGEVICDTASHPTQGPAFNIFDGCTLVPGVPETQNTLQVRRPGAASDDATVSIQLVPYSRPSLKASEPVTSVSSYGVCVPALVAFINGEKAAQWSGDAPAQVAGRRDAVLAQLASWFGPAALHPLEYIEADWPANPYTRGCPIATYGQGVLEEYGVHRGLAEPAWPVEGGAAHALFFAGTETSPQHTGFMAGAIKSGHTAAEALLGDARVLLHGASAVGGDSCGGAGALPSASSSSSSAAAASAPLLASEC